MLRRVLNLAARTPLASGSGSGSGSVVRELSPHQLRAVVHVAAQLRTKERSVDDAFDPRLDEPPLYWAATDGSETDVARVLAQARRRVRAHDAGVDAVLEALAAAPHEFRVHDVKRVVVMGLARPVVRITNTNASGFGELRIDMLVVRFAASEQVRVATFVRAMRGELEPVEGGRARVVLGAVAVVASIAGLAHLLW